MWCCFALTVSRKEDEGIYLRHWLSLAIREFQKSSLIYFIYVCIPLIIFKLNFCLTYIFYLHILYKFKFIQVCYFKKSYSSIRLMIFYLSTPSPPPLLGSNEFKPFSCLLFITTLQTKYFYCYFLSFSLRCYVLTSFCERWGFRTFCTHHPSPTIPLWSYYR